MKKMLIMCSLCMDAVEVDRKLGLDYSPKCPKCKKGFMRWYPIQTTQELVDKSRAELDADREKNKRKDTIALRGIENRVDNRRSYSDRLRDGFALMNGRAVD